MIQNENQSFEMMLKIFTFLLYLRKHEIKYFLYKQHSIKIS